MNKGKSTELIIEYLSTTFTFLFLIVLFLRQIRSFFPVQKIGKEKIIGYINYYGYPGNFDNLLFLLIILSPFFSLIIIMFLVKKNEKNN